MKVLPKRMLGVDAGFRNMGVVLMNPCSQTVLETYVYSTQNGNYRYVAENNRGVIEALSERLAAIIRQAKPDLVVSELPTGAAQSYRAAVSMSYAFSVVVLTCKLLQVPLRVIMPQEIKKLVAPSDRKVPKEKVIAYVRKRYGSELLPKAKSKCEHVADAIACLDAFLKKTYGNEC